MSLSAAGLKTLSSYLMRWLPRRRGPAHGVVLSLGGGGARGLAHIGVLEVLAENDIPVRAIAGTSIGAEIGGFMASGMSVAELAEIATEFNWLETMQLFLPDLPTGGLVSGKNIIAFLDEHLGQFDIESLPIPYVAVAADLETGKQVIIDKGNLVDAVRASISMPGIIMPHRLGEHWLVDGGVVNPIPFDVAHARFGGPVVAVSAGTNRQRPLVVDEGSPQWTDHIRQLLEQPWMERIPMVRDWLVEYFDNQDKNNAEPPYWTLRRVLDRATEITQEQINELRAKLHPPDLIIKPDVNHIGVLEFYEARAAIQAGRDAALAKLPDLQRLVAR